MLPNSSKLKAQYEADALSEADFKARLEELMLQDEQGRWWMIGYETGQWYVNDGQRWVQAEPSEASHSRPWLLIGAGALGAILVIAVIVMRVLIPIRPSVIIDTMDSTSGWDIYATNPGATVIVSSTPGKAGNALQVSFALNNDKWVGISRQLHPEILDGTKAIAFCYQGSGQPNTLEIKLIYAPDDQKQEAIFSVFRNHATDTHGQWVCLEIPYTEFSCWIDTGCSLGEPLDVSNVQKIDFAISSKKGDIPGTGTVLLDDVRATR